MTNTPKIIATIDLEYISMLFLVLNNSLKKNITKSKSRRKFVEIANFHR